jgi:uracil-DNA glycosylase
MKNINSIDDLISDKRSRYIEKIESSSDWGPILVPWLESDDFEKVLKFLSKEASEGNRFSPVFKDIFNAFIECPYQDLKAIIIGQDPYPQFGVADGISFSCSKKGKAEKSLQHIFNALYGDYKDKDCNLARWSNQGILMLNTALTVRIDHIGSHYAIWKPFITYLFEQINSSHKDIAVVCMGKKAEEWKDDLDQQHLFFVSHPASAAYNGGKWKHDDVFNRVNKHLESQGKTTIIW